MISNVYNYYMSEYGAKPYSKYNSHKKSELKDVYNNIVKISKSSPFYDLDLSEEAQKRAIDIKENARSLSEITEELTDATDGNMTFKSIAKSSNEDVIDAKYIGDNTTAGTTSEFTISVDQLATPQVNTGNYLNPQARGLFSGTYSFDVNISSITYELQFSVKDDETNIDVQNKLSRLINKSNIGLTASVDTNDLGQSALVLTSNMTGVGDKPVIFTVNDGDATALSGTVDAFGLNHTSSYPSNAVFKLNGDTKISTSNNFTVDRQFDITLKDISKDGEEVKIGLKQNMDSLVDSIHELANSYNKLTNLAKVGSGSGSQKLFADLTGIASSYNDILSTNGMTLNENGLIDVDDDKLKDEADSGSIMDTLSQIGKFKNALKHKANSIMINPMEYVNKSIISYKNPARPTMDPYTTSIYSGMMFNGYC